METDIDHLTSLTALSEIAQAINTLQEPDALLEKVLEIAMEALDAERGFVLLTSGERSEGFEVKNSRNFTEQQLGEVASDLHAVPRTGAPAFSHERR